MVYANDETLWRSITLPPALNVDSEVIVVIGVDNISLTTLDKMQYLRVFAFHQSKALNFTPLSTINTFSSKYACKSDLAGCYNVSTLLMNESNISLLV